MPPEFDERPASLGICFGNTRPRLKMQIVDGDTVTLKLGGIPVIVRNITSLGSSRRYRGTIAAFENWSGTACGGYSVGDEVQFAERQVFGCAMP